MCGEFTCAKIQDLIINDFKNWQNASSTLRDRSNLLNQSLPRPSSSYWVHEIPPPSHPRNIFKAADNRNMPGRELVARKSFLIVSNSRSTRRQHNDFIYLPSISSEHFNKLIAVSQSLSCARDLLGIIVSQSKKELALLNNFSFRAEQQSDLELRCAFDDGTSCTLVVMVRWYESLMTGASLISYFS